MRPGFACGLALWVAAASPAAGQGAASRADSLVAAFYAAREGRFAWASADGEISPQAWDLVRALATADEHGLDPRRYGLDTLGQALQTLGAGKRDSLLTRAFLSYAADIAFGRIAPARIDPQWTAHPPNLDLVRSLEAAIASGQIAPMLRGLARGDAAYVALSGALLRYRDAARQGTWPVVEANAPAPVLHRRLAAEGYATVRRFQAAHGLEPDGIVGPHTRAALNVPPAERAAQIALNLERWRWLPRPLGARHIVVNSAAFTLAVVEHDTTPLMMRVVGGRPDWPTPIISSVATAIAFRPFWVVPRTIAVQELLPLLRRAPRALERQGIRVYADTAPRGAPLDAAGIDWSAVTESTFRYRLVQDPGPRNPLGRMKLVFATPFFVLLHDTPERALFAERVRAYSHGCVRVADAPALAAHLLPAWAPDSIRAAMAGTAERWVRLEPPVAVHLVYWTAWVNDDGVVEFRDDAYGWDAKLRAVMGGAIPVDAAAAAGSGGCEGHD